MIAVLIGVLAIAVVLGVAYFVLEPLRSEPDPGQREEEGRAAEMADLDARKEAKYREIRDAELDRASGKLSDEDFRRQDAELRREAVEILERIEQLSGERLSRE
jgi:flagellar biosynthesis/type III secretory pathway M-ring protein FliF/YscJ